MHHDKWTSISWDLHSKALCLQLKLKFVRDQMSRFVKICRGTQSTFIWKRRLEQNVARLQRTKTWRRIFLHLGVSGRNPLLYEKGISNKTSGLYLLIICNQEIPGTKSCSFYRNGNRQQVIWKVEFTVYNTA